MRPIDPVFLAALLLGGFTLLVHAGGSVLGGAPSGWRVAAEALLLGAGAAGIAAWSAQRAFLGWADELRAALRGGPGGPQVSGLARELREHAAELAAELGPSSSDELWTPERLRSILRRTLAGDRVLVLSNREPLIHERGADGAIRVLRPASGLVTALEPVVRACSGTWIAHGSGSADRDTVDAGDRVWVPEAGAPEAYRLRRVWMNEAEEQGYYFGFANEGLWPLCHVAHTRPVFRGTDWEEYQKINRRFADAVCDEADGEDPVVLVQDYHFALAPLMIRERLPQATILTFWHIPWPNAERIGICPWRKAVLEGLLGSSILGFHTQQHCNHFHDAVDAYLQARIDRERSAVVIGAHSTLIKPYPISIEWPVRALETVPPAEECRAEVFRQLGLPASALLGVGVDRLDYTKGIEERLLTVERLLEAQPDLVGTFVFAQLAAPSRTQIPRYQELDRSVEALSARINERFGSGSYQPIALLREHHGPEAVYRFYRAADLCYVSSLHDGMNLVAKEFCAARDDERGVLVLSRFTGAARELPEALLVNPYDLDEAASAFAAALSMSGAEQGTRMRSLRSVVAERNVWRWAGRMLLDSAAVRRRERLVGKLASWTSE